MKFFSFISVLTYGVILVTAEDDTNSNDNKLIEQQTKIWILRKKRLCNDFEFKLLKCLDLLPETHKPNQTKCEKDIIDGGNDVDVRKKICGDDNIFTTV